MYTQPDGGRAYSAPIDPDTCCIMKKKSATARIEPYTHPAAGWGALKAVTINLIKEKVAGGNYRTLLRQNQPDGFDCRVAHGPIASTRRRSNSAKTA